MTLLENIELSAASGFVFISLLQKNFILSQVKGCTMHIYTMILKFLWKGYVTVLKT